MEECEAISREFLEDKARSSEDSYGSVLHQDGINSRALRGTHKTAGCTQNISTPGRQLYRHYFAGITGTEDNLTILLCWICEVSEKDPGLRPHPLAGPLETSEKSLADRLGSIAHERLKRNALLEKDQGACFSDHCLAWGKINLDSLHVVTKNIE